MSNRHILRGFVALALCGALTACGSTSENQDGGAQTLAGDAPAGDGLTITDPNGAAVGVAGPDGTIPGGSAGGVAGNAGAGVGTGTGAGAGGAGGVATGSGASSGGGAAAPGAPAAGKAPIKLGITYPDTTALAAAFAQESHDAAGFLTKI